MVVYLPREKFLLFSVYINSYLLTAQVEYVAIIGSRLIAEFIFQYNLTAADKKSLGFRLIAEVGV